MSYYRYPKAESAAQKKARAAKAYLKLKKKLPDIEPVLIEGRTLAKNWWGKAWNQNLESYADYSNRIGRGKTYVRSNTVLDLKISRGLITGMVMGSGSRIYDIRIKIDTLSDKNRDQVLTLCNNQIDSLEQLLAGKFPESLEVIFKDKKYGLFPSPEEIQFGCTCPDWASMCKHVAAVLYGTGSKLDQDPMLFFVLRDLDGHELVRKTMEKKLDSMLKNAGKKSKRSMTDKDAARLFGL